MYSLVKKYRKYKMDDILELIGYPCRVSKTSIVVYNQELIDSIIISKIYPELNKLIKQVLAMLENDDSDDNSEYVLDELARVYAAFINNYERYLSSRHVENYMKNFRVLTNELKQLRYRKRRVIAPEVKGRRR